MTSLFARLSAFFLLVLLLMGFFILWLADRSARQYFLEFTQQLNRPIAMYMAQSASLVVDGAPDRDALARLARHVMMVNPSVEVYLLGPDGEVLAHSLSVDTPLRPVRLGPIERFLSGRHALPLLGDNPRDASRQRAFSVHPLEYDGRNIGYVYAVLTGERHQTLLQAVSSSYTLKSIWITTVCVLGFALLAGCFVFFILTRRLRLLTGRVQRLQGDAALSGATASHRRRRDELDELTCAYESMAQRLLQQYRALARNDRTRRELFANISHDLRTPLATMHGYLETLQLKCGQLDDAAQRNFVDIALRQSTRLNDLVGELFELSKLSAGEFELCPERFSIAELAHDCAQDFAIRAQRRQIDLRVDADIRDELDVIADVALMHRLFENLLDNALRYTPVGGSVCISVHRDGGAICVRVSDTGAGMARDVEARAFDRHYSDCDAISSHAGLGLAIVRSIVDLHGSDIRVRSRRGHGTSFAFELPAAAPQPRHIDYDCREPAALRRA